MKTDEYFITNEGKINYNDIHSIPTFIKSTTGEEFIIYSPTYKEFVLLMRRGPQIIYPKDVGSIIIDGNIRNDSTVLEIAQKISKMIGASVQEIDPLSENYLENMRKTAKAISRANY